MRHPTVAWRGDCLLIIDQTALPVTKRMLALHTADQVFDAIRQLNVRGAPAIGISAAFGLYLGVRDLATQRRGEFLAKVDEVAAHLETARPTAVNLAWALRRMRDRVHAAYGTVAELKATLLQEAQAMIDEDNAVCLAIGRHGRTLLRHGMGILTHCNAGGLGTAQYGTALAPVYVAAAEGTFVHVFADETRPVLQGARLTAWELKEAGIPVTLLCDNMAAVVMAQGRVEAVIVGTDRVARNGDVANKIGTYGLAVLAHAHGIPFYVAAPRSSIDLAVATGGEIPIETRDPLEVTAGMGRQIAPDGIDVMNPAFDVTPARYVTAFITEVGLVHPPYAAGLAAVMDLPAPPLIPLPSLPNEPSRASSRQTGGTPGQ